jgi:adenosylcobinamide kinase / adenosylcobinamide-phosphate guanylyltransferase
VTAYDPSIAKPGRKPVMTDPSKPSITLVLGGARSGKSAHAERLLTALPAPWAYIATAEPLDDEMRDRIASHKARRGEGWAAYDVPVELVGALTGVAADAPCLVDCLTLWVSNLMHQRRNVVEETVALTKALSKRKKPCVLVSNEVGLGIVPDNALARAFRDEAGRLNQHIAAAADRVIFVAAGLPLVLKG